VVVYAETSGDGRHEQAWPAAFPGRPRIFRRGGFGNQFIYVIPSLDLVVGASARIRRPP